MKGLGDFQDPAYLKAVVRALRWQGIKRQDSCPLVPVYSHRYLPAEPKRSCNAVLSVHQTDVVVYGETRSSNSRQSSISAYRDGFRGRLTL